MLATAVGVEPEVKADVGGVIACDHAARVLETHLGGGQDNLFPRGLLRWHRAPAIVKRRTLVALEPVRLAISHTTALERMRCNGVFL